MGCSTMMGAIQGGQPFSLGYEADKTDLTTILFPTQSRKRMMDLWGNHG